MLDSGFKHFYKQNEHRYPLSSVLQCDCPKTRLVVKSPCPSEVHLSSYDWLSSLLVLVEFIPHHTSVLQCGCPKTVKSSLVEHHLLHLSDDELLTDSCTPHSGEVRSAIYGGLDKVCFNLRRPEHYLNKESAC